MEEAEVQLVGLCGGYPLIERVFVRLDEVGEFVSVELHGDSVRDGRRGRTGVVWPTLERRRCKSCRASAKAADLVHKKAHICDCRVPQITQG